MIARKYQRTQRRLVSVCLFFAVGLMAISGCKKKKPVENTPEVPERFVSSPGELESTNKKLTCEQFTVPDSANGRRAVAAIAAALQSGGLGDTACFLHESLVPLATQLDVAGLKLVVDKGSYQPWDVAYHRGNPPHWATSLPADATDCQVLSVTNEDGTGGKALYFCRLSGRMQIVKSEHLGISDAAIQPKTGYDGGTTVPQGDGGSGY